MNIFCYINHIYLYSNHRYGVIESNSMFCHRWAETSAKISLLLAEMWNVENNFLPTNLLFLYLNNSNKVKISQLLYNSWLAFWGLQQKVFSSKVISRKPSETTSKVRVLLRSLSASAVHNNELLAGEKYMAIL
jgi:hypothetical protein